MLKIIERFLLWVIDVDRVLPLQIDITNACNLKCSHCYHSHHKNIGAISFDEWKKIIIQYKILIKKMRYRPKVVISGGEPLGSPLLKPIIKFIFEELKKADICILTNATLINKEIALDLRRFTRLKFQVSLDGPDSERHDLIRGKGNFKKAINGIRILKSLNFKVNILSILSKKTNNWMEDFFILAKIEKFNSLNFIRFVTEGDGRKVFEESKDEPLVGIELKSSYEKIIKLMIKYKIKSIIQGPLFELVIPGLGRSGKFWEAIVIDYKGYILASSRSSLRLGHAINDGLEKIFLTNKIYKSLREGLVEVCGTCSLYRICGGDRNAAFAATGNFLGFDPACWKQKTKG